MNLPYGTRPICARCNLSMSNNYTIQEWNQLSQGKKKENVLNVVKKYAKDSFVKDLTQHLGDVLKRRIKFFYILIL
jgi:hypothetical protein